MRCARCGRTSCARVLELGELARGEADALLAAAPRRPGRRRPPPSALWELSRGNALFLRELVRHGAGPRAAGRGRRRVALARPGRGRAAAGASWWTCASTGSARARAGCSRWWPSAGRWSSALLPASWRAGARGARASAARTGAGGSSMSAHPLHGEAVRARLDAHAAGGDPGAARRRAWRRAARGAAATCCGSRRGDSRRARTGDGALFARAAEQALAAPDRGAGRAPGAGGGAGGRGLRRARWRSGARWPPRGAGPEAEADARGARGGQPTTTVSAPWRWPARATCSGAWTAPTTPTPCCATPRTPWPTPGCARNWLRSACASTPGGGGRRRRWPAPGRCSTTTPCPSAPG